MNCSRITEENEKKMVTKVTKNMAIERISQMPILSFHSILFFFFSILFNADDVDDNKKRIDFALRLFVLCLCQVITLDILLFRIANLPFIVLYMNAVECGFTDFS